MTTDFDHYEKWVNDTESQYAPYAAKSTQTVFLDGTTFEEYYSRIFAGADLFDKQRNRFRTPYQLDRDRMLYSPLFQRLAHKTQLFTSARRVLRENRLTHTLKVAQISRSVARGLQLNEDLVEAIALGHDIGHAPFAHIGEIALNEWIEQRLGGEAAQPRLPVMGEPDLPVLAPVAPQHWKEVGSYFTFGNDPTEKLFMHGRQGFRLLVFKGGSGPRLHLRFSKAVMYGVWRHSVRNFETDHEFHFARRVGDKQVQLSGAQDLTLETQVVRLADDIAWIISDLAEGLHTKVIGREDVNSLVGAVENTTLSARLRDVLDAHVSRLDELYTVFISDLIEQNLALLRQPNSGSPVKIDFSWEMRAVVERIAQTIRTELHNRWYVARGSRMNKARIKALCDWYCDDPDELLREMRTLRDDPSFPIQMPMRKKCEQRSDYELYEDLIKTSEVYRVSVIVDLVSSLTDDEIHELSETMPT